MLHSELVLSGAQCLRALLKAAFLCAWSRESFFDMQVYGLVGGEPWVWGADGESRGKMPCFKGIRDSFVGIITPETRSL